MKEKEKTTMNIVQGAMAPLPAELIAKFRAIVGDKYAVTDEADIAPYVTEERDLFHGRSPLVLRPGSTAEVSAICKLASISGVVWLAPDARPPQSAAAAVGDMSVHIPMAGLIDVGAELERIARRREKLNLELNRASAKLGNENFVRNAPAEVVTQERERLDAFKRELAQLAEQHERVASLR